MRTPNHVKHGLLALSVCLLSASLFSCTFPWNAGSPPGSPPNSPPPYVSPHDFEQLVRDDSGRLYYYQDGMVRSRFGVDVSEHQGHIDWQAAADDGVEFALIRLGNRGATEGHLYLDAYFEANLEGAEQAGILTGVYFFSQAINEEEAREEAQFVLTHLDGRTLNYPVAFDHERVVPDGGRVNSLNGEQVSRCAAAFFEVLQAAGYTTMLYGNSNDLNRLGAATLDSHDLWFAEYGTTHPTLEHDLVIWQYTSHGSVEGIPTYTDLNIHFLPPDKQAATRVRPSFEK